MIIEFVEDGSGGDRFESVTVALFFTIGKVFRLFKDVRRTRVTASDTSTGMIADIECINDADEIVMVVEAKDRGLTITQMQDKIPGFRENRISEAFFVAGRGMAHDEEDSIRKLVKSEFITGQNVEGLISSAEHCG